METATGKFGLEFKKERGDTLVEWATSKPNGVAKTTIDYFLTTRPDIITDVTVNEQHQIDRRGRKEKLMTKKPPRIDAAQIGSKKIELQLELRNPFDTKWHQHQNQSHYRQDLKTRGKSS